MSILTHHRDTAERQPNYMLRAMSNIVGMYIYAFCLVRGIMMCYVLLRTCAVCPAFPRPPTRWTHGAMCYKGLCVMRGMR
jgi:hypothetical protein